MTLVIKQNYCHDAVLHDALAITVHRAEPPLRPGKALLSSITVPANGCLMILANAEANLVYLAEVVLRGGITLLGEIVDGATIAGINA